MIVDHQHHSEMKETEELLAAELNKLSVEERSKALDDVHCVGQDLKETPELVEQSLKEFDTILMQTTSSNRIYYDLALQQNRAYVEDPAFRLKFLRTNRHNVTKSVHQMMSFLEQKALCFGDAKVAQHILPSDMNAEDVDFLKSGVLQILKEKDPSGRAILYRGRLPADCKIETLVRYYESNSASDVSVVARSQQCHDFNLQKYSHPSFIPSVASCLVSYLVQHDGFHSIGTNQGNCSDLLRRCGWRHRDPNAWNELSHRRPSILSVPSCSTFVTTSLRSFVSGQFESAQSTSAFHLASAL